MNIVFYAGHPYWGGLRNCGGARTILLSAETLREFGHKVDVVAVSDKFTWFKHRKVLDKIPPNVDVVIACSISDLKLLHSLNVKPKKVYWGRALETWQMPENSIKKWLGAGHLNIVNSSWLHRKYLEWGIKSHLCWQGVDIHLWNRMEIKREHSKTVIGCLYNKFHKTKRWDSFIRLREILGDKNYMYYGFGADKPKETVDEFVSNPTTIELIRFYSKVDIWFSPTELDSFHNVPLEAALCGCLIVCNKTEKNGMEDYATDDTAMRYETIEQAASLIREPDYSKVEKMKKVILEKIGTRGKNMKRLLKIIKEN